MIIMIPLGRCLKMKEESCNSNSGHKVKQTLVLDLQENTGLQGMSYGNHKGAITHKGYLHPSSLDKAGCDYPPILEDGKSR